MYRYFGMIVGKLHAVIALTAVSLTAHPNNHAAVWLGASTHNARNWVQAGVEQMGWQRRPHLYFEVGSQGRQIMFRSWPITAHEHGRVYVRLRHAHRSWQVVFAGHASPWVYLPNAETITVLETQSSKAPVRATAFIDGRIVHAR